MYSEIECKATRQFNINKALEERDRNALGTRFQQNEEKET